MFAIAPLLTGILVSVSVLFSASAPRSDATQAPLAKRTFYRYAALVSVGAIAYTFASRIDQFLLPVVVSSSELGIYVVAVTVAEVPLIVGMVLSRNLVSEVAAGRRYSVVVATYVTAIAIAASAALTIALVSEWAVPTFFGAEFTPAIPIVRVLSLAAVFSVASAGASAGLNGLGRPVAAAAGYAFPIASVIAYVGFAQEDTELLPLAVAVLIGQALCATTLVSLFLRRLGAGREA
jgi:O-antigen/teichoic acid export membrane protein